MMHFSTGPQSHQALGDQNWLVQGALCVLCFTAFLSSEMILLSNREISLQTDLHRRSFQSESWCLERVIRRGVNMI
jgi:hypothetical protein